MSAAPAAAAEAGRQARLCRAAHRAAGALRQEMQNGVVLAVDELNAEARDRRQADPFELISEDDQADPDRYPGGAKLVDEGIQGMIGHFNSGTSIPASKVYSDAGIPQIAMATSPVYTAQGYKTTFRAMTSDAARLGRRQVRGGQSSARHQGGDHR